MNCKTIKISALLTLLNIALLAYVNPAFTVSWSNNLSQLTDHPYFDGAPAITETRDGDIWIVWSRDVLGYYILYYTTSSNSGANWAQATNLTAIQDVGDNLGASIIESANGTMWIFWSSNSERTYPQPPIPDFYMNATPASLTIPQGGTDYSTITATSTNNFNDTLNLYASPVPGVTSLLDPTQVYVPSNGTVTSLLTVTVDATATPGNYTLTVIGEPHHHRFLRSVDIELEITESNGLARRAILSSSSLALSSAAGSQTDFEIFCKTSNDYGATWSNDIQITDNSVDDTNPSVVQLANGTIMVVWQSIDNGNQEIFYMTSLDGTSWSDEKLVTTHSGLDRNPSVIQAKDGRIWVAWTSNRTGDLEVFSKTYNGLSWSSASRRTFSSNLDTSPSMLQTVDEKIWIFWTSTEDKLDGTGDIYYMYSSDNGDNWSDWIQFTTDSNEDSWSAVTQTHYTRIWVVWTSNRADQPDGNWEIYYRTSLVGDINEDGIVNLLDIYIVAEAWGYDVGEPGYNPDADLNKDGLVDVRDLLLVCRNYSLT